MLARWAHRRFSLWCEERRINGMLKLDILDGQFPFRGPYGGDAISFIKSQLPPMGVASCYKDPVQVHHGTYPKTAARVISERRLTPSAPHSPLGGDCRTSYPACFCADTIAHRLGYAHPGVLLNDNLYYSIFFEVIADRSRRLEQRRGEQLYPPDALHLRSVYLCCSLSIVQGGWRSAVTRPDLEVLPEACQDLRGTLLKFQRLRPHAWY